MTAIIEFRTQGGGTCRWYPDTAGTRSRYECDCTDTWCDSYRSVPVKAANDHALTCTARDPRAGEREQVARLEAHIAGMRADTAFADTKSQYLAVIPVLLLTFAMVLPPVLGWAVGGIAVTAVLLLLAVISPRYKKHPARTWMASAPEAIAQAAQQHGEVADKAAQVKSLAKVVIRKYRLTRAAVICLASTVPVSLAILLGIHLV